MSSRADAVTLSVIVPCRDGARYLAETLRSVLAQDFVPLEVLVVDDGSLDGSVAIAESFGPPVRCVRQAREGAAAARNRGAAAARGDVLGFLDADDLWTDGAVRRLMEALHTRPDAAWALGATEQFASPELDAAARARLRFDATPQVARLAGALLVRRTAFERVGPFSTALATGEFIDWFLRADELGLAPVEIHDVVLRRRLHRTNHGVTRNDARGDYARVIKAALDRRRAADATGSA